MAYRLVVSCFTELKGNVMEKPALQFSHPHLARRDFLYAGALGVMGLTTADVFAVRIIRLPMTSLQ